MSAAKGLDQVNYLNIFLMIIAALLAYVYPFELFLFSYGVMGPLHYLTEISWLHDRHFYTKGRFDWIFLVLAGLAVTLFVFHWFPWPWKGGGEFNTCLAFLGAFFFAFFNSAAARLGGILSSILVAVFFLQAPWFVTFFGLLLPTLIHVYVFTGLFILLGALKGRSLSGILSLVVFAAVGFSFWLYHPLHENYQISNYVRDNYGIFQKDGSSRQRFYFHQLFSLERLSTERSLPGGVVTGGDGGQSQ